MTGTTRAVAIIAAFAAGVALIGTAATAQQKKGGCVLAGGEATMITSGLAEFMAKAALKNSINGMGAKPVGDVKLNCKDGTASVYCIARQKACK